MDNGILILQDLTWDFLVFLNFFHVHFCAPRMYATHMLMLYSSTSVWTYTSIRIYSMQTYASHAENCCTCDVCTHAVRMHTVYMFATSVQVICMHCCIPKYNAGWKFCRLCVYAFFWQVVRNTKVEELTSQSFGLCSICASDILKTYNKEFYVRGLDFNSSQGDAFQQFFSLAPNLN
jgi:hypothetical protein